MSHYRPWWWTGSGGGQPHNYDNQYALTSFLISVLAEINTQRIYRWKNIPKIRFAEIWNEYIGSSQPFTWRKKINDVGGHPSQTGKGVNFGLVIGWGEPEPESYFKTKQQTQTRGGGNEKNDVYFSPNPKLANICPKPTRTDGSAHPHTLHIGKLLELHLCTLAITPSSSNNLNPVTLLPNPILRSKNSTFHTLDE